jgi:putative membrane protein
VSERLRFIISGFFVGLAELLPGISGSTVAVAFNVYDKFILFLANLKLSNLSFNLKKLNEVFFLDLIIPFFLSMVLSVILASNLILYLLSSYTEYYFIFYRRTYVPSISPNSI